MNFIPSQTVLCGNQSLLPWEPDREDFGRCFQVLVLSAPAHTLLALACAYGMGVHLPGRVPRSHVQRLAADVRAASSGGLLLSNLLVFVLLTYLPTATTQPGEPFGLSNVIETGSALAAWSSAAAYALTLKHGGHPSHRGVALAVLAYVLCFLADLINSRSVLQVNEAQNVLANALFPFRTIVLKALRTWSSSPSLS